MSAHLGGDCSDLGVPWGSHSWRQAEANGTGWGSPSEAASSSQRREPKRTVRRRPTPHPAPKLSSRQEIPLVFTVGTQIWRMVVFCAVCQNCPRATVNQWLSHTPGVPFFPADAPIPAVNMPHCPAWPTEEGGQTHPRAYIPAGGKRAETQFMTYSRQEKALWGKLNLEERPENRQGTCVSLWACVCMHVYMCTCVCVGSI